MWQPKFWKPKYKAAASMAPGPAAQEPTSNTCFSSASHEEELSFRHGLLQPMGVGRTESRGAEHGVVHL